MQNRKDREKENVGIGAYRQGSKLTGLVLPSLTLLSACSWYSDRCMSFKGMKESESDASKKTVRSRFCGCASICFGLSHVANKTRYSKRSHCPFDGPA
jgi:hypothetical protein